MADPSPLPDSPEDVEVSAPSCATLARAAGRVSTALATARITRQQACYRPVTDDGLPLIGRVPMLANAYVATGHGPWGILNAPGTGLSLAELITEGAASSIDLEALRPRTSAGYEARLSCTKRQLASRATAVAPLWPFILDPDGGQALCAGPRSWAGVCVDELVGLGTQGIRALIDRE